MPVVIELTTNIMLLLSLLFIYSLARAHILRLSPVRRGVLNGVIFGIFAIIAMLVPFTLADGFIFDGRGIVLAVASFFGGFIPGLIAAVLVSLYRLSLGGGGAPLAVGSAVSIVVAGILLRHFLSKRNLSVSVPWLLLLGTLVALITLSWFSLAPPSIRQQLLQTIAIPVLILHPIGVTLAGLFFQYMKRQAKLAETLRESEERYRTVVGVMAEGVVVHYEDQRLSTMNQQALRLLGPVADAVLQLTNLPPGWEILQEDGKPTCLGESLPIQTMRSGQSSQNVVIGLRNPEGLVRWFSSSSQPLINTNQNKPYGAVTTLTDITAERQTKDALAQEHNLLRTVIDNIPDLIFVKDTQSRFLMTNKAVLTSSGRTDISQLIGSSDFDFLPNDIAQSYYEDDQRVFASGQAIINKEEQFIDHQTNQETMLLTSKIPLWDESDRIKGLVGISRNITHRKQLEVRTLELAAERERISVLQRFIGDLSHDFRTPLAVLSANLYLMQKITDPRKLQIQVQQMENQIGRLDNLLAELLHMSYLDRQETSFEFRITEINAFVEPLIQDYQPMTTAKNIELAFDQDDRVYSVEIDTEECARAIKCLLDNAIAYTPEGGRILIRTAVQGEQAVISVQDTGAGIGKHDLPHIFERFYRADGTRSTVTGGNGLGLSIARRIIEAHHGSIEVESTPGHGSTFSIRLPLSSPETDETPLKIPQQPADTGQA